MRKPITVSGLVQAGAIKNNLNPSLPKFKNQADFSNEVSIPIPLTQIQANPYQPRRIFPEIELQELADSITEIGLIQPIAVRKVTDDAYQIIAGERRFRAFKLLGKSEIPCVLFNATDADMAVMAIAENVNRQDLSDYEIAKSIRSVETLFQNKTRLAEALGLQREDMYRYFAFETLPEFVLQKLELNPRLLARNAAADIKRVLNKISPELLEIGLAALQQAMILLEQAEIEQTKIAAFIEQKVKQATVDESEKLINQKELLLVNSKKVGHFASSVNGLEIRISVGVLSDERELELKKMITEFLNRG